MDAIANLTVTTQTETTEGTAAQTSATADSTTTQTNQPAADLAQPAEAGKTYTDAQLDELKAAWQQEYEQSKAAEKDFEKMTPDQQAQKQLDDQKAETARLQAELADRDLTDYARAQMAKAELPDEALSFIKGKDQADIDSRIKVFSQLVANAVQTGVEGRFKGNGYTPRGSAAGNTEEGKAKKARGVSINEKK